MQTQKQNGLKPIVFKYMALLMGICYMINPLQHEINSVLHHLSHQLTPPSSVVSHHDHNHVDEHQSPEHYNANLDHEHLFMDLVNTIFEASNEEDHSEESIYTDVKWDKHISSTQYEICLQYLIERKLHFYTFTEFLIIRHANILDPPPQVYHT